MDEQISQITLTGRREGLEYLLVFFIDLIYRNQGGENRASIRKKAWRICHDRRCYG